MFGKGSYIKTPVALCSETLRKFEDRVGKLTSSRICGMPQEGAHSLQGSNKVVLKFIIIIIITRVSCQKRQGASAAAYNKGCHNPTP